MSFADAPAANAATNGRVNGDINILEDDASMPIAIIGLGGRFPGEATNPERLWEMVSKGRNALSEVPKDRFNIDAFYHPHAERQGTMNIRGGHFLKDDISAFDAPFFSITPSEAAAMDPQQRIALEVAYEALENAGLRIEDISGSSMACYMASFTRDYANMRSHDPEDIPKYEGTGNGSAMISNRISWFFNLHGTSLSLDTACSSSLVALHLACQSIRTGESKSALVGGTNLILMPEMQIAMTSLHFLSPDSKSQSFDSKANGYSRGEGGAVVVLKPLADALRDGNVIRAVIRGTGVNQDGHTPGITLPSADAQEELIRQTYKMAGLPFKDTNYFEAHGTGTPAGDPLECSAIGATFGAGRPKDSPLLVGSIKSNIGHLEGVSGVAGLVKAIYTLEKAQIPPNLWFDEVNPRIHLTEWGIKIPTEKHSWPAGLRRASVNSFGYGGTNAHCIIDDAYNYLTSRGLKGVHNTLSTIPESTSSSGSDSGFSEDTTAATNGIDSNSKLDELKAIAPTSRLFLWASHEQSGSDRTSKALGDYLREKFDSGESEDPKFLDRLAYTLSEGRSRLPWKTSVVASTVDELCVSLEKSLPKPIRSSTIPVLGFIFTGQGAQWFAMGRELLCYSVFRESLEKATAVLTAEGCSWNLLEEFLRDEISSRINEPELSQPLCAALQVAFVDLLSSWGITPSVVIGHSSGEIGAAYASNAISSEWALKIAYHRGRLSSGLKTDGGMLAAGLGATEVQPYLDQVTDGQIVVACINSPSNVTLSGDSAGITQVQKLLDADKVFARRLLVKAAYHSPHMQALSKAYLETLQGLEPNTSQDSKVVMFSSVTGKLIDGASLGAEYWVANMVSPVKFSQAVQAAITYTPGKRRTTRNTAFVNILVEVGPHAALQGPLKQILNEQTRKTPIPYISMLTRGNDARATSLDALGKLAGNGYPADILKANSANGLPVAQVALTDLPPYAWNRSYKYWHESPISRAYRHRELPRHDLVGVLSEYSTALEPSWTNYLRVSEMPWMEHHKVQSSILYPLAGMLVMVIEASRQISDKSKEIEGYEFRDVSVGQAMIVPAEEPIETKLQFRPWRQGSRRPASYWREFTISCRNRQGDWQVHCTGLSCLKYKTAVNSTFADETAASIKAHQAEYKRLSTAGFKPDDPRQVYASMAEMGLQWGPTFKTLTYVSSGDYESHCVVEVPETRKYMPENFEYPHVIHPACLDGFVQMMIPASTPRGVDLEKAMIPRFMERLYISSRFDPTPGTKYYGYSTAKPYGFNESLASIAASTEDWNEPLVIIEGCRNISLETMTEGISSEAVSQSLRKLGAHPTWDIDMQQLPAGKAVPLFKAFGDVVPDADSRVVQELELASFILVKRVLKEFSPTDAETFTPHLKIFYQYMQHRYELGLEGKLDCQSLMPEIDWMNTTEDFEEEILARVSAESVDGKLMCRLGAVYNQIFRGEIEPLQVMRDDDVLTDYYRYGIGVDKWSPVITKYIQTLSHKKPDLKILEVGAGTGGTTSVVLSALGSRDETSARLQSYTFTDISSGFFEKAAEDFKTWEAFLEYKVVNIEMDITKQGVELGAYDLVIANNVLHATSSVDTCLANCKAMLKPGGTLLLGELTSSLARIPMIFGTLSGWWMGDNDGRKWGPRLSEPAWDTRLKAQGFNGLDMCFRDHEVEELYSVSLMLSTANPLPKETAPEDILIVIPDDATKDVDQLSLALLDSLVSTGSKTEIAKLFNIGNMNLEGKASISLLEADTALLHKIDNTAFEAVKHMIMHSESTLWLSRGGAMNSEFPEANLIAGLGRTIRGEIPGVQLTSLDLDPVTSITSKSTISSILQILRASGESKNQDRPDWEYAIRNELVHVPRIDPDAVLNEALASSITQPPTVMLPFKQPGRPLALAIRIPGMLDTFQFEDDKEYNLPLGDEDVEIAVKAVGMNFHDVMISMGQIQDTDLGVECSGIVTRTGAGVTKYKPGDKVITFRLGCFRTFLRNNQGMFEHMPDDLSFEEAASIPCIYTTVYYSIFDIARLEKGESILIHAAAGGLGQAAIILAQYIGAEIFVTVSTDAKKQFLIETYGLAEDHIFNSRDLSFAQGIKRMTGGRGVDVVLNSLAGEALRQTWLSVAPFGRFIELGKADIFGNTGLDMRPFLDNITFAGVNLLDIQRYNIPLFGRIIGKVMKLLAAGVIRPIGPIDPMGFSQIEEAFRIMQTGKHIGKMVLTAGDDDIVPMTPEKNRAVELSANATYLIPGGLGGLGRSIASWMVDQGARNLVFTSRSGDKNPKAKELIADLTSRGAKVSAFACDTSDVAQFAAVLETVKAEFPPIRGVLTCAMHLQDVFFENMSVEDYNAAIRPKVQATRNLHDMLPKDLDFFICLSSIGGIIGSRGQGNYNAGNTYQDALAHYRRSQGLKATSINLGVVLGVGITAERGEILGYLKTGSMIGVREQELLTVVQAAMANQLPAQAMAGLATGGLLKQNGHEAPYWFSDGRFAPLRSFDTQDFAVSAADSSEELQSALAASTSLVEAGEIVCTALMRKLAKAMMMEIEDLDSGRPANSYGVDSLVAVEVRAWVFKEVKSDVSIFDILSNRPLATLAAIIAGKSSLVPAAVRIEEEA